MDIFAMLGDYRVVDLSKKIDPSKERRRCTLKRHKAEVLGVVDYHTDIDIMTHLGTHVEAPYHHGEDLPDTASLPFTSFMGRCVLLKLDTCKPKSLITRHDLDSADKGRVKPGDIVLLDSNYHSEPFITDPKDCRPQLSRESAEWFLEKGVKSVGFGDGIAIENNPENCVAFHEILMTRNVTFIEVLQNLDKLKEEIFLIVFMPLPIKGLDSSPVHVIAIEGIPGFCGE